MAASSLEDLLNFEVHFESAAITFINDELLIDVFGTVTENDLTTPRIEVEMQMEESEEFTSLREGGSAPTTKDFTNMNGVFNARVITDNAAGAQAANHATYRAKCRKLLLYSGANWDSSTLPYYDIKWLQPGACTYLTDQDFNITEMAWSVKFAIRDDAWPS